MEINQLQAKILNIPEVAPDDIDLQMISELEKDSPNESISWEDYKAEREERGGNISLRVPKDLHRTIA